MSDENSPDFLRVPSAQRAPNPFVQKVKDDFGPPSPVAVARDLAQPATGCFKKLKTERSLHRGNTVGGGASSEDVLRGRELENETLSPTLRRDVQLVLGRNCLLARRTRLTL